MKALKLRALAAQQAIHSYGVYHGDIEAWNFLWNHETESLTLIDFGEATFKDWDYFPLLNEEEAQAENASLMRRQERKMLWSMLRDFGVKGERDSLNISCLIPKTYIEHI